jgi:molybdenum cofactor synthesis domain-containing protein
MQVTAAILTVSDSCANGTRQDLSGPALRQVLKIISTKLREMAKIARFVVTTGGTGISERDVTPEATRDVCERLLDGVSELMRSEGLKQTPLAPLSRALCGTLGHALVLNVPGNPKGAEQSLKAVLHLVPHVLELLDGKTEHKSAHT